MARRLVAKQLGGSMRGPKVDRAWVDEPAALHITPRTVTHLYVGTRRRMDHWMLEQNINPSEHGRRVAWANNGPEQLQGTTSVIEIVYQPGYTITDDDRRTIIAAEIINTVF